MMIVVRVLIGEILLLFGVFVSQKDEGVVVVIFGVRFVLIGIFELKVESGIIEGVVMCLIGVGQID